jgi:hypothetical protein
MKYEDICNLLILRQVYAIRAENTYKQAKKVMLVIPQLSLSLDHCFQASRVAKKVKITSVRPPAKKTAMQQVSGPLAAGCFNTCKLN